MTKLIYIVALGALFSGSVAAYDTTTQEGATPMPEATTNMSETPGTMPDEVHTQVEPMQMPTTSPAPDGAPEMPSNTSQNLQ